ncbi:ABC transporter ATP-binding protein [Kitasatospora sp. SUK 42]|uniref:ABC transporter ATP-binding protein n=1 Tax=Kitasatospora sp. SUK 42 TaxID=1588882 RepID=UPI0027E3AC68|nr:ABC transporter ATP-binding protein [Kitasatospora sp. SUK 42]
MRSTAVIAVSDLVKRYGGRTVVDNVSFQVEAGEVFGLLGPNGAGKTTTVEILEGVRTATSGRVEVLGADPAAADRHWRSRVGVVAQGGTDHGDWRVGELVAQFARYHGSVTDPRQVIELVGLTGQRGTRADRLSGGQRRKLDVALGIVGRPELLFLDEPTTGFDPEARREFWEIVRDLARQGTTIVLTTHYLDEASNLADRLCVVKEGRVLQISTPGELGREHGESVVSWRSPEGVRSERTDDVAAVLRRVEAELGGSPPDLEIRRPSLEDRYLAMIGEDR